MTSTSKNSVSLRALGIWDALPQEIMSAGNQTTMFAALSEARDFLSQRATINFTHGYFSRSTSSCPFALSRSPQVSVWLKLGPKSHGSSKKAYYRCLVLRGKPNRHRGCTVALLFDEKEEAYIVSFRSRHGRT